MFLGSLSAGVSLYVCAHACVCVLGGFCDCADLRAKENHFSSAGGCLTSCLAPILLLLSTVPSPSPLFVCKHSRVGFTQNQPLIKKLAPRQRRRAPWREELQSTQVGAAENRSLSKSDKVPLCAKIFAQPSPELLMLLSAYNSKVWA